MQLRKQVIVFGLVLIVLIVGIDTFEAYQDHGAALERSQQTLELVGTSLTERLSRTLQNPDSSAYVRSTLLLAPDGSVISSTGQADALPKSVLSQVSLHPQQLQVAVADTEHPPVLYAFRAVSSGLLVVGLDLDTLLHIDSSSSLVTATRVKLLDLQRSSATPPAVADGWIRSQRNVDGYPLAIEVSRPRWPALAEWRHEELESAARTWALAAVAGVLLVLLAKHLRKLEEAEAARRAADDKLAEARRAEALSLLAASVAHDFNNVLGAVVGYGELARTALRPPVAASEHLDRLLAAAERGRKLVRRVLTFDTQRSLQYSDTPLSPVLREVLEHLPAIAPPHIRITAELGSQIATVKGDATEIYQVVMNLCTNAMHAMPDGGMLQVELEPVTVQSKRPVALGTLDVGSWWCISVTDHGSGLSQTQIASIFDPLYTTKALGEGTGLGLTVVRNIVTGMQGVIEVESEPGSGSRFSVYLPAVAVVMKPDSATEQRSPLPGSGQAVLIVDDETALVTLLEELVASLGYEPIGFSDPNRALEFIRRDPGRVDALLTDELMLQMRGLELARAARKICPQLPIVLATAYRSTQLDEEARAVRVSCVLDKPVHIEQLRRALAEAISATTFKSGGK